MGAEDASQIRGDERVQPVEIGARIIQIADHNLGHAQARGLARHGLARVDLANDRLTHRFCEEPGGETADRAAHEFALHRGARRFALAGITGQRNQEKSGRAGIPCLGIDGMHKPRLLANGLPQDGTVAASKNRGEHIERGRVGVREAGNLPAEIRRG